MVVLALTGFFMSMDITLTTLLIEPMKRDMGLTDIEIGLLQGTAFGLAFGLSSIPLGRLIDSHNRIRLLVAGLLVWMLGMAGTAFASSITLLVLCRIALGVVFALIIPAAVSVIADLFPPEKRSVATSLFAVGQASGQAFGILAGGLMFDALTRMLTSNPGLLDGLAPWRALYLAAAFLAIVLLVPLLMIEEPTRQERKEKATAVSAAFRELWAYRSFLIPLLAAMLFSQMALQAASVWATPLLIRNHHLSPGQFAGWLSGITFVGGIVGALAGGQGAELGRRRKGRAGVLIPALIAALATAPLSFFALAPGVPLFAAMLALNLMMGAATATIGVIAITLNIPNEIRGLALGSNVFVSAVFGVATAPAAIALLSQLLGGEAMLGQAIAGVSLPGALLAAVFFVLAMRGARRTGLAEGAA
jgi:MFS family permease